MTNAEPNFDAVRNRVPARTDAGRATADRLIAATRLRSAEFPATLANHLPMILEALARLGATASRLEAFAEIYNRVNDVPLLAPCALPLTRETWRTALGDRSREADCRRFFLEEARRLGGPGAVRRYVPLLAHGVGASATHALMRLAYGLMRGDDTEVGTALGYWTATFLPLPQPPAAPDDAQTDEPLALAAAMRAMPALRDAHVESPLLWGWIKGVGSLPDFAPLIGRLRPCRDLLDRVAAASLALYAGTMSFEALHALTGSHWLRLVAPHLDDPVPLVRCFWQVILAVLPKIGLPEPPSPAQLAEWRAVTPPPEAAVAACAIDSDDEHDISLVFSALQEGRRTGDPLYRVLAARRVGLLA